MIPFQLKKAGVETVMFVLRDARLRLPTGYYGILTYTGMLFLMHINAGKNAENWQNKGSMLMSGYVGCVFVYVRKGGRATFIGFDINDDKTDPDRGRMPLWL